MRIAQARTQTFEMGVRKISYSDKGVQMLRKADLGANIRGVK